MNTCVQETAPPYPEMLKIRQALDGTSVSEIGKAARAEFNRSKLASALKPGQTVAITAGSRGITDIVPVLAALVEEVKARGGLPFLVPAMGSHGGATAEGQAEVLAEYGITEEAVGAPIRSSMSVAELGEARLGIPVYLDRNAMEADHIVVVNRIKAHTEFHGKIESGLVKMLVIGLGKHKGATTAHQYAVKYGYERTLIDIGRHILSKAPVSLGLGIVENGYRRTALLAAIEPGRLIEEEERLLLIAREKTAKLPFAALDILIVDEAGKDISGTGLDTKVIGRIRNIYEKELERPAITRIVLRDLSAKTHGNGIGVGLVDFITRRAAEKIDPAVTLINTVTAVTPEKGQLPLVCRTDKEAVDCALSTSGPVDGRTVRVAWIRNTSQLDEMLVSSALLKEAARNKKIKVIGTPELLQFDADGNISCPAWNRRPAGI